MPTYVCEHCDKEFTQKIDYTRHKNKKNACVSIEKVMKIVEEKKDEKENLDELSSFFSSCMNIMRDKGDFLTGDKALRNLSYLLIFKLIEPKIGTEIDFDEVEYDLSGYTPAIRKKLKTHYIYFSKFCTAKDEDLCSVFQTLWNRIFSVHPKTKDFFPSDKKLEMKQATIRSLTDKLANLDFSKFSLDIQGHAYEKLLEHTMTGKILGQFFTQPLVKNMMVELIAPKLLKNGKCETVYDPALGTAGFLLTVLNHLMKESKERKINLDWKFISGKGLGGREGEQDTFSLAKSNTFISTSHFFDSISQGDSIRDPITEKYDIILTNPPFGIKGMDYKEMTSNLRDEYLPIKTNSAVPLFLQANIYSLKIGGRCAMVVPYGEELFGKSKGLPQLREYLMKTCDLKEVIILPSGVFTNTSIKTCVFYFHKKKEGNEVITVKSTKTKRTYSFVEEHATKTVKFYDYNPYEKVKNLLSEVDIEKLAKNQYCLNHIEYQDEEEKDEKEDEKGVEYKTLGELLIKCEDKIKLEDEKSYKVIGMSSLGYSQHKTDKLGEEIKMKTQQPTKSGQFVISKILNYCYGFITPETANGILSSEYWLFDVNNVHINTKYFNYIFPHEIQPLFKNISNGVGIPRINFEKFKSLKIPIPLLEMQEKIVEKLDFIHEKCLATNKDKIEQLKKEMEMYIELSTFLEEKKTLEDLCKINQGKYITKTTSTKGKYPVYGGGGISFYIDSYNRENELIIAKDGVSIDCVRWERNKFFLNHHGWTVNTDDNVNKRYLFFYLHVNKLLLYNLAKGTAQKGICQKDFYGLKIPVPSLEKQQEIVNRCEHIETTIKQLEENSEKLKLFGNDILKQYLTTSKEPENEEPEDDIDVVIDDDE